MKRWLYLSLALLLGFGAGSQVTGLIHGQQAAPPAPPVSVPFKRELSSYREIVKAVQPAVVSIDSKTKVVPASQKKPALDPRVPEELRKFFDQMPDQDPVPQHGFGSGFFIDQSGIVLTNAHVVAGADQVTVTTHDGRKFVSKDIKSDPKTDLAIVTLDPKGANFTYLELGDSEEYEIGDRVIAFGAPFGLTGSVTQGIVSAKGRSAMSMNTYEDFIQTDAAINPGNSGGPLVGLDGKVIGINAAIKSRSGGFQGVGLAVSSNLAKSIVKALRTDGVVHRGYLGVEIRDLAADVAERLGVAKGVVITKVTENSPAAKANLVAGDIITSVAGRPVRDGRGLSMTVANLPLGKAANLDVHRDGKAISVPVTIEEMPQTFGVADNTPVRPGNPAPDAQRLDKMGIEITDLNDDNVESFGFKKGTTGVVITKVNPGPAADAGLRRGTMIMKVDNRRVTTAAEARTALEAASMTRGVVLQVNSPTTGTNFVLVQVRE